MKLCRCGSGAAKMVTNAENERGPHLAEIAPHWTFDVSRSADWSGDGAIAGTHGVRLSRFETGGASGISDACPSSML
jgi:hypothetical protein